MSFNKGEYFRKKESSIFCFSNFFHDFFFFFFFFFFYRECVYYKHCFNLAKKYMELCYSRHKNK